jgi:hypothetical protein
VPHVQPTSCVGQRRTSGTRPTRSISADHYAQKTTVQMRPVRRALSPVFRYLDNMSDGVNQLRLERPPVREVRLAYIFGTVGRFRASYVGGLYDQWRERYPEASEGAPLRPFNRRDTDYEFLSEDGTWPVPFTTYADPTSGRNVSFQSDRFAITWEFGPDAATQYPGFDALAKELNERFSEFSDRLANSPAGPVQITHTECQYVNRVEGVSPRGYAKGLLLGWESVEDLDSEENALESVIFSQHLHFDDSDDGIWISISPAEGEKQGTELILRSLHMVTDSEAVWRDELNAAHDLEIQHFISSTSQSMREAWGER